MEVGRRRHRPDRSRRGTRLIPADRSEPRQFCTRAPAARKLRRPLPAVYAESLTPNICSI